MSLYWDQAVTAVAGACRRGMGAQKACEIGVSQHRACVAACAIQSSMPFTNHNSAECPVMNHADQLAVMPMKEGTKGQFQLPHEQTKCTVVLRSNITLV